MSSDDDFQQIIQHNVYDDEEQQFHFDDDEYFTQRVPNPTSTNLSLSPITSNITSVPSAISTSSQVSNEEYEYNNNNQLELDQEEHHIIGHQRSLSTDSTIIIEGGGKCLDDSNVTILLDTSHESLDELGDLEEEHQQNHCQHQDTSSYQSYSPTSPILPNNNNNNNINSNNNNNPYAKTPTTTRRQEIISEMTLENIPITCTTSTANYNFTNIISNSNTNNNNSASNTPNNNYSSISNHSSPIIGTTTTLNQTITNLNLVPNPYQPINSLGLVGTPTSNNTPPTISTGSLFMTSPNVNNGNSGNGNNQTTTPITTNSILMNHINSPSNNINNINNNNNNMMNGNNSKPSSPVMNDNNYNNAIPIPKRRVSNSGSSPNVKISEHNHHHHHYTPNSNNNEENFSPSSPQSKRKIFQKQHSESTVQFSPVNNNGGNNGGSNANSPTQQHYGLNHVCQVHKDQFLTTVCHTCQEEIICALCAISKHKGHDVDLIEEIFEKEKFKIKDQITNLQNNIYENLEKFKQCKLEKEKAGEDYILETFEKIEKKLEEKKINLIEQWKNLIQEKVGEKVNNGTLQLTQLKFLTENFLENLENLDITEFIKKKKSFMFNILIQQFLENLKRIESNFSVEKVCNSLNLELNINEIFSLIDNNLGTITINENNHNSLENNDCPIQGKFISSFGGKGTEDGQFTSPTDICIDSHDNIIICDNENNRVQIFDKTGKFIRKFRVPKPYGVTVDSKENTILVTSDDHCVYCFDLVGNELGKFGSYGTDFGHFSYPTGVFVVNPSNNTTANTTTHNESGKIIVCDHHNHRLQIFDKDGTFLKSFGTNGNRELEGGFYGPNSVDLDIEGHLVISDRYNSRIQVFTTDGIFIKKITTSLSKNEFDPTGICCIHKNQFQSNNHPNNIPNLVVVCDYNNNRIQIWNINEGNMIKQFGSYGTNEAQFDGPNAVAMTSDGYLVVVDYHNHRVQIFK
ncbi:hypothetical protein ABK040_010965 [Willaertia magna]